MANYEVSYQKTKNLEGVKWSDNKNDRGGETYSGVARNFWPSLSMWKIIDSIKESTPRDKWDKVMAKNAELQAIIKAFYKQNFWDVFRLDEVPAQDVADEIFDTAVNGGPGLAASCLQKALNVLNKMGTLYPDIVEDGAYGPTTFNTLLKHLKVSKKGSFPLLTMLNVFQGVHYAEYCKKSPTQEEFMWGWVERVTLTKA